MQGVDKTSTQKEQMSKAPARRPRHKSLGQAARHSCLIFLIQQNLLGLGVR